MSPGKISKEFNDKYKKIYKDLFSDGYRERNAQNDIDTAKQYLNEGLPFYPFD